MKASDYEKLQLLDRTCNSNTLRMFFSNLAPILHQLNYRQKIDTNQRLI